MKHWSARAAFGFIAGIGAMLLPHASCCAQQPNNEIRPPFNLTWGETADRLERLVGTAGGKVVNRKMVRGNREAVEVEGLLQEGLKKTVFYFKQGILTGVELQYQADSWNEEKYNSVLGDLRSRISSRYGEGTQIARKSEQVGVNNVLQTVVAYRWTVNATSMQLVYFSATDPKNAYRAVSVHYTAF